MTPEAEKQEKLKKVFGILGILFLRGIILVYYKMIKIED